MIGKDRRRWVTRVPTYDRVVAKQVWPGIDVVYHSNASRLECDYMIAAGVNPEPIAFEITGARAGHVDRAGDLVLNTDSGDFRMAEPAAYQSHASRRHTVKVSYALDTTQRPNSSLHVAIRLGPYDRKLALAVDPLLLYSSFINGNGQAFGVAADASGGWYVTGTASVPFASTNPAIGNSCCSFVTKFKVSPTTQLVYQTLFGGSAKDEAFGVAADSSGSAYVVGTTTSADFPTSLGAYETTCEACASGFSNAFVIKLSPAGDSIVYSTFIGGDGNPTAITTTAPEGGDFGLAIAVNQNGQAYVTGQARSTDFPLTSTAYQSTCPAAIPPMLPTACAAAFVTVLNDSGTDLIYSSLLGGSVGSFNLFECDYNKTLIESGGIGGNCADFGRAIAVNATGQAYLVGRNELGEIAATPGAFGNGGGNFIFEIDPTLSGAASLVYATYLSGAESHAVAVDPAGKIYTVGTSVITGPPLTSNAFRSTCPTFPSAFPCNSAFVTELDPSQSGSAQLVYSTLFGGDFFDDARAVAVDGEGRILFGGLTLSTAFDSTNGTECDNVGCAFAAEIDPSQSGTASLLFSSPISGSNLEGIPDLGNAGALDPMGNFAIVGSAGSANYPTSADAIQQRCPDPGDRGSCGAPFVSIISPVNAVNAKLKLQPSQLVFPKELIGTTGQTSKPRDLEVTNLSEQPVQLFSIATPPEFSVASNTCPQPIPPQGQCSLGVTFTPAGTGRRTGSAIVTSNATTSTFGFPGEISVALTGQGVRGKLTRRPAALSFGRTTLDTTSAPKAVQIVNSTAVPFTISSIVASGDFNASQACLGVLAPETSCAIEITFSPTAIRARRGTLSIEDDAANSPQTARLGGVGVTH